MSRAARLRARRGAPQYLTRPFVVGDRVELKSSGGGSIVMGVVESISMMRTQLRTDRAVPISIPNRAITDMIVSNESHIKTPSASIAVRGPLLAGSANHVARRCRCRQPRASISSAQGHKHALQRMLRDKARKHNKQVISAAVCPGKAVLGGARRAYTA